MANEASSSSTNPNRTLCTERYELGRVLGKGNSSVVKLARNTTTGDFVAIKIFNKEQLLEGKKEAHRRIIKNAIKQEISILGMVKHPNVVRVIEVMATKKKIYIVMEHVDGELFDKINKTSLCGMKEREANKYFHQLICALDYCHSKGVTHGDIKESEPENVLVGDDGVIKLSDFGLSALPKQADVNGFLYCTYGTPKYTAPEATKFYGYEGRKADIWACGVTLFFMVAGYLPFTDADENLKRLVRKMLDPNPHTRITIDQMYQDEWFMKFYQPLRFPLESVGFDYDSLVLPAKEGETGSSSQPPATNALAMCSTYLGFNLVRNLLNKVHVKCETIFISQHPIDDIIEQIEVTAKSLGFKVRKRSFQMNITLREELARRHGHQSIVTKIYEMVPHSYMVEVRKVSGDNLKFHEFYKKVSEGHIILKAEPIET
ncbi:unnamed protein product [Sphenostylis stenocarpa]|uniref:Protein kinase domain-containing protein n=1 Tax=Sphenostylis stenocarpa TaxID=92480 RepID=A0AA86VDS3_9FABA|nr:unnamed protein product [Sphenostylis stenocarpa]